MRIRVTRIGINLGLIIIVCLFAGVYGMLRNQVSYTVSPEYFTKFKFIHFGITYQYADRLASAYVGFLASWWMGLIISPIVMLFARKIDENRQYFRLMIKAFFVVLLTSFTLALLALLSAYAFPDIFKFKMIRKGVLDNLAFSRAGTMHNFSYLGGIIGIFSAWIYLRKKRSNFTSELEE